MASESGTVKQFQIWMEGYAATGESGTAQMIGEYKAVDFNHAVKQYSDDHLNQVEFGRLGENRHSIWACELFDNEKDARKFFG